VPIYEYICESCGKKFDFLQKISDPPIEVCPECGGKMKKLISAPAIKFKGTGWYVTDYGKGNGYSPKDVDRTNNVNKTVNDSKEKKVEKSVAKET